MKRLYWLASLALMVGFAMGACMRANEVPASPAKDDGRVDAAPRAGETLADAGAGGTAAADARGDGASTSLGCDPRAVSTKAMAYGYSGDYAPSWDDADRARASATGVDFRVSEIVKLTNDRQKSPYYGQPDTTLRGVWLVGGKSVAGYLNFIGYKSDALRVTPGDLFVARQAAVSYEDLEGHPVEKAVLTVRRKDGTLVMAAVRNVTEERPGDGDAPFWPSPLLPEVRAAQAPASVCRVTPPAGGADVSAAPVRASVGGALEAVVPNGGTGAVGAYYVSVEESHRALVDGDVMRPAGRAWKFGLYVMARDFLGE